MILTKLEIDLKPFGMSPRGAFHPGPEDAAPAETGTVIMIGNAGPVMWQAFSSDIPDGPNPMDTWTRQVLEPIAVSLQAQIVFPFSGPPHYPFQRWAMHAEAVTPSPIGPLVHPDFGMWHAYRGALLFRERFDIPLRTAVPSPCDSCPDKPCMSTCPVGAFTAAGYDVAGCRKHIASPAGSDCLRFGCLARRACPIGQDYIYEPAQAQFHMQKFLDAGL